MNDLERYAVALLGEENVEVAQMAFKAERFGLDHERHDGLTARHGMSIEMGDVLAAMEFGVEAGILDAAVINVRRAHKFAKLVNPASVDDQGNRLAPALPGRP